MKLAAIVLSLAFAVASAHAAAEPLRVVASFSILGDMTERLGGERVAVSTLVGPDGDAHVYAPTPQDAVRVAEASLLVVNGLGFEGWIDRLVAASGYEGPVAVAAVAVAARPMGDEAASADGHAHDPNDLDPHAWQSVANAERYAEAIAAALTAADPAGAEAYAANLAAYVAELDALDAEIRALVDALPPERRTIVTSHDAFGYFAAAYGLTFVAPQGVSTEAEASAADLGALIRQIRDERIPALFVETISDERLLAQVARETGAVIGGALYSDALSGPDGPASSYVGMMRHNARTLTDALAPRG